MDSLLLQAEQASDAKEAVELSEKAFRFATELNVPLYLARAAHRSGIAWKNYAEPNKSLERLTLALKTYRDLELSLEEHVVLIDLGETYRAAFQQALAVIYLKKARSYFQSVNDGINLARVYDRLAASQYELLFSHPDYETLDTLATNNHRNYLDELKNYPELSVIYHSSVRYVDSALVLAAKHNLLLIRFSSGILHASLANSSFDIEKAIDEYEELIRHMKETGVDQDLPLALINQARIIGKYRLNQPKRAIALAEQALNLATERNIPVYQYLATEVLHDNYLAMGDFETAYHLMGSIKGLYERLQFDKMKLVVTVREYEFEMQERDRELRQRKQLQRMILLISIIVVLAISGFLLIYFRANKRLKGVLGSLREQSQLIKAQNQELGMVNSQKDRLISIIAHDLRNPFNSILGFSELIQEEIHSCEPADIRRYAGIIRTSAQQTLQLLTSLLEWSRFQEGRMGFSPEIHSIRSIVLEALQILLFQSKQKSINIHLQITGEHNVMVDRTMIVTVLRNLVSNALKFTHPEGEIWIEATETEKEIQVQVRDSGIGMSEERKEKLFKIDSLITTPGTRNELGSGFGLILTKEFLEKHNGRVWVESEEGKGSTFFFTLPKA